MSTDSKAPVSTGDAAKPIRRRIFLWASAACGVALFALQIAQLVFVKQWNPLDTAAPVNVENWIAAGIILLTSAAAAIATATATVAGAKVENHIRSWVQNFNSTNIGEVAATINSNNKTIYDNRKSVRKNTTVPALPPPVEYEQLKATIVGLPEGLNSVVGAAMEKFLAKSEGNHLISDEQHARILAVLQATNAAEAERLRRDLYEAAAREKTANDLCEAEMRAKEASMTENAKLRADLEDARLSVRKAVAFAIEFGKANSKAEEFLEEIERKGLAS